MWNSTCVLPPWLSIRWHSPCRGRDQPHHGVLTCSFGTSTTRSSNGSCLCAVDLLDDHPRLADGEFASPRGASFRVARRGASRPRPRNEELALALARPHAQRNVVLQLAFEPVAQFAARQRLAFLARRTASR